MYHFCCVFIVAATVVVCNGQTKQNQTVASGNATQTVSRQFSFSCPNGLSPQISSVTGQPQSCNQFTMNSCQVGFQCVSFNGISSCCSSNTGIINGVTRCPNGAAPLMSGLQPAVCQSPGNTLGCPVNYMCTTAFTTTGGSQNVCCPSSGSSTGLCPNGQPGLNQCSPGQTCASGFSCVMTGTNIYQCCSAASGSFCTTNGVNNFLSPGMSCFSDNQCPLGNTCQITTTGARNCCPGTQSGGSGFCTNGMPLTQTNGMPQTCNPTFNSCPTGFQCTFSPNTGNSYCCSSGTSGAQCPIGQPLLTNGVPQQCTFNVLNSCPVGYQCLTASNGQMICCSTNNNNGNCSPGTLNVNGVCRRLSCTLLD